MTVDSDEHAVMGKGVRKELEVYHKGVNNDINFSIADTTPNTKNTNSTIDYLYISDDEGNKVYSLSVDYLNSGRKYYVNQDVLTASGSTFKIYFNAQEVLLGSIEESKCELNITTVNFEISDMDVCGVNDEVDNVLELLHGATIALSTEIGIKEIVVGSPSDIEAHKKVIGLLEDTTRTSKFTPIELVEYDFASTKITEVSKGKEDILTQGKLHLQQGKLVNGELEYTDILSIGTYGGITLAQHIKDDNSVYFFEYYEIKATTISDDTRIRIEIEYYFDENDQILLSEKYLHNTCIEETAEFMLYCLILSLILIYSKK